jgi:hypothetical protein
VNRLKFLHDGQEYIFDPAAGFSVGEAVALEEDWNLTVEQLDEHFKGGTRPPLRVVMALLWMTKVRGIAARDNVAFLVAAGQLPAATFDVGLESVTTDEVPDQNPTRPGAKTRTPGTPTTRRTSAGSKKRAG